MRISDRKRGNICILELSGQLSLGPAVDRFADHFDKLLQGGERQFVFDMVKVPWMDTSGINAAVACHKYLRDKNEGGEIKVVLRGKGHSLFVFYELHKIFDLHEDVESALASFAVSV